jgi:hypothetical protein
MFTTHAPRFKRMSFPAYLLNVAKRNKRQKEKTLLLQQSAHLIKLSGEEVKAGDDAPVWTQLILLHDLLVVDGVPDVNVSRIGHLPTRGVQVHYVRRLLAPIKLRREPLDKGRLPGARHAQDDDAGG